MSTNAIYISKTMGQSIPKAICEYFKLDSVAALSKVNAHRYSLSSNGLYNLTDVLAYIYALLIPLADKYKETGASHYELAYKLVNGEKNHESTKAVNVMWIKFVCIRILVPFADAMKTLLENVATSKSQFDAKNASIHETVNKDFESILSKQDYLSVEGPTLADFFACFSLAGAFDGFWKSEWIAMHPATFEWFKRVQNHPFSKSFFTGLVLTENHSNSSVPNDNKIPKKVDTNNASDIPKFKFIRKLKHPLELLGKSTFNLDEWKREYSNNDTRPVALPWFWEHYNPEEYSIWKVSYKYNDELTLTFMSNNLVGGFINRLSGSIKYMFGCLVVYGENNNNGIIGAVMIRGQDFKPAFDVAPDWESYDYEKLDVSTEENKEFVNNMWAWDKPVVINGESKEIADGKVLKNYLTQTPWVEVYNEEI